MNQFALGLRIEVEDDGRPFGIAEIQIDRKPLVNFGYYATDLQALVRSINEARSFFIVTCWCGDPLCAGIKYPVNVYQSKDSIQWSIRLPRSERRTYVFQREQYQTAIEQGIRRIREARKRGKITGIAPPMSDDFLATNNPAPSRPR
jgi:hypothetical protein